MTFYRRGIVKSKFGAIRTEGFASKLENSVYHLLLLRMNEGEFTKIIKQKSIDLAFGITWKVDFSCERPDGTMLYCEAKGMETPDYRLKVKMWAYGAGPGVLEIWKGSYQKPYLEKTIIPKKISCLKCRFRDTL